MRTITLDILDNKAVDLLKDLEALKIIKLHEHDNEDEYLTHVNKIKSYKGQMTKQSPEEIEKQLSDLRNEWN